MRRLLLALALSHVIIAPARAETALPGWLAGTWAMEDGAAWADEVWMAPRGNAMLGLGRAGFGPDVESWQSARIVRRADGSLSYFLEAKGGASVEYPMVVASAGRIEFANGSQEFPQRIRVWREGQLLMIELSRIDGGDAVRRNYRPVETAPKD